MARERCAPDIVTSRLWRIIMALVTVQRSPSVSSSPQSSVSLAFPSPSVFLSPFLSPSSRVYARMCNICRDHVISVLSAASNAGYVARPRDLLVAPFGPLAQPEQTGCLALPYLAAD